MSVYNPKNELKLMILYLLSKVSFSLNHENLSNFFLENYTTYIQFQQILAELVDTKLIEEYKSKTSVFYKATDDGLEALSTFENDITIEHKDAIQKYIKDNKIKAKEESQVSANYSDSLNGNYRISLTIHEDNNENIKIEMDVPTNDAAITMCENWKEKAKNIYAYIIKQLL